MRRIAVSLVAVGMAVVAGCGDASPPQDGATAPAQVSSAPRTAAPNDAVGSSADALLHKYGLQGKDAQQIIDHLDRSADRPRDLLASIRYDHLELTSGEEKASLPLPEGKFYVSVAPYVDSTHDCFYHSLTTCQGELVQRDVDVKITDARGKALVDSRITTYPNGFIGFWLPRDASGTLTVSAGGRSATTGISTGRDAATCLTTLKLT